MKAKLNFVLSVLLLLFVYEIRVPAQVFDNSISGRVIDNQTGEVIPYVNIYIAGTIWGTMSNNEGRFEIRSVYPAEHELVISMIGYEVARKTVEVGGTSHIKLKDIRLKPKEYLIEGLEVVAEKPDEWQSNLKLFKNLFLGSSIFAMDCEITNEAYIDFNRPSENVLIAKIGRPLHIINKALGFEVFCDLLNFKYDENETRLQYMITTSFKEMKPLDETQKKRWEQNRLKAYKGSIEHFLFSFIKNKFITEGYEVSTSRIPYKSGLEGYRQKILASDSLVSKNSLSGEYQLTFPFLLQIVHKKASMVVNPVSWIKIMGSEVMIDEFGYPKSVIPFETYGYWSQLGVANLIPKYYFIPDQNSTVEFAK